MQKLVEAILKKLMEQATEHREIAMNLAKTTISEHSAMAADYHRQRAQELDEIIDCIESAIKKSQPDPKDPLIPR
jgi:hypothetical protein